MNDQQPPIDRELRRQLARRSARRLPERLLADVSTALDSVRPPQARVLWRGRVWRAPRLAVAAMGAALVAVLLVVIAFPPFRGGPAASSAAYPAERALTTAELAALMAGPPLATNTALVASVTIDAQTDVCPMDRYPTIGVVEGMGSRLCVMGGVAPDFGKPETNGTFAFRYLGPGYLGLLGQITSASASRLAFHVADDWSFGGATFLVDGWLGAYPISCPTYVATTGGDPLDPDGEDQCEENWLTDDPNAQLTTSVHGLLPPGEGRLVQAGGMRLIDGVQSEAPAHGIYVVRTVTAQCPGASPQSNAGCGAWRVLAKVAEVSIPAPIVATSSPAPTPTTAPPATPVAQPTGPLAPAATGLLGPGSRPLTVPELEWLWAADSAHLAGRIAIVKGPVPTGFQCAPGGATEAAASSTPCPVKLLDGEIAGEGYLAVRVEADGKLALVGKIAVPSSGFVFTLDQVVWPATSSADGLAIVDAWLDWEPALYCDTPPYPSDSLCGAGAVWSVMTSAPVAVQPMGYPDMVPPPSGITAVDVGLGSYQIFGSQDLNARPIHGIYLMSGTTILARLEVAVP